MPDILECGPQGLELCCSSSSSSSIVIGAPCFYCNGHAPAFVKLTVPRLVDTIFGDVLEAGTYELPQNPWDIPGNYWSGPCCYGIQFGTPTVNHKLWVGLGPTWIGAGWVWAHFCTPEEANIPTGSANWQGGVPANYDCLSLDLDLSPYLGAPLCGVTPFPFGAVHVKSG